MIRHDPNLVHEFFEYMQDEWPEISMDLAYIHWHEMVSEYCVYIDDKWSGYVPEEYIFKSGLTNYKRWADAWAESTLINTTMDMVNTNVRTLVKFCKEKGNLPSDYMDYVRYFVDNVRCSSITPEMQDYSLNRAKEWMERNDYPDGVRLMVQELGNPYVKPTRIQRTV